MCHVSGTPQWYRVWYLGCFMYRSFGWAHSQAVPTSDHLCVWALNQVFQNWGWEQSRNEAIMCQVLPDIMFQ